MKKIISAILTLLIVGGAAVSCGANNAPQGSLGKIYTVSREEGSGTRGAFVELFGIVDDQKNDRITDSAEITSSTSVMLATISGNKSAIGYVSLGSLTSDVKTVDIDGVAATAENIKNGTYKIARPFLLIYKEGTPTELAKDFMSYILSSDGQKIVSDHGYISVSDSGAYKASGLTGTVKLAGSTSVSPVIEKLADAYKAINSGVAIEVQQTGSSAGITSAIEGVCDFGMSSRELKESEASKLTAAKIAVDGIAVIANKSNSIGGLTSGQVKDIFKGDVTEWSAVQ
mgnify:CR=1 FL=1